MKGPLNSSIDNMNPLPRTNTFLGVSSPAVSTVSEMTTNTRGYKNKVCNVGTSVVDGNRAVVSKKESLPVKHSAANAAVRVEKRIQW